MCQVTWLLRSKASYSTSIVCALLQQKYVTSFPYMKYLEAWCMCFNISIGMVTDLVERLNGWFSSVLSAVAVSGGVSWFTLLDYCLLEWNWCHLRHPDDWAGECLRCTLFLFITLTFRGCHKVWSRAASFTDDQSLLSLIITLSLTCTQ
jgi:hypothetical protein